MILPQIVKTVLFKAELAQHKFFCFGWADVSVQQASSWQPSSATRVIGVGVSHLEKVHNGGRP